MSLLDPLESGVSIEPERYELSEDPFHVFSIDRRDFLRTLGGGLLVLCLMSESEADPSPQRQGRQRGGFGGGGAASREISAWIHLDETGNVEACTGKVEVGQNARTSLTQAVADELHLPLSSVRMLMGDTDRVPFDMGTFGSRTTPTMVPQLRRAAAAARAILVDLAAKQLNVPAGDLVVRDGKVTHPGSNRSLGFAELMKGQSLVKPIEADTPIMQARDWKVAGTSVHKVNARAIVTGAHAYTSDHRLDSGAAPLVGKVLRPPAFEAKLVKLDPSSAQAIPGVRVIHDGDFVGLTAPDEATALKALAALRAEWKTSKQPSDQELPALLTEGGPSIEKEAEAIQADVKIKSRYNVAYIAHAPLEPRAAYAEWTGPERSKLRVATGTQRPFGVRGELARAFGISETDVQVTVPDTGSGYGGKHSGECAIEAARLAKGSDKPVRLVWTREEEFTWAYFRPAGVIDVAAGASRDGKITAWRFHNYNSGGSGIESPYEIPDKRSQFHQARSPLRQGSYRALASTANHFARESAMDELALALSIDPLEFRRRNLKDPRLLAVLEAAAERFGWGRVQASPGCGSGMACGTEKGGFVATFAEVEAPANGPIRVTRLVTAFECGAIINPDHLKNQVEGSLIMGLGGALFEAIRFADGKIVNPRFSRYRVPRFSDIPKLETILIDRKDLPSAGAGESPIIAVAPAVGNAICQATGKRLRAMPMLPELQRS